MTIQLFEDKYLSHFSYAILEQGEIILIDPARNPHPYYEFAHNHSAKIIGVIETHLHADFISSHLQISNERSVKIYMHPAAEAHFDFIPLDETHEPIELGKWTLQAIHTPGHSPDSICILLCHEGVPHALFTGDTLFFGDVGRPDLRENSFSQNSDRVKLAAAMYHSIHSKILPLKDNILIYPAHGAGSLCGKIHSTYSSSTIGYERNFNPALAPMSEIDFVARLLDEPPMIPKYFSLSVASNRSAEIITFETAMHTMANTKNSADVLDLLIIDPRPLEKFKEYHIPHSINIPNDFKFETWLGSLVAPNEYFKLIEDSSVDIDRLIERIINIGYDQNFKGFVRMSDQELIESPLLDLSHFELSPEKYTIIDVRNFAEVKAKRIFSQSISIPLDKLRGHLKEIPMDKPVVTHCGGGSRGAMASSILLANHFIAYDLGKEVKRFNNDLVAT